MFGITNSMQCFKVPQNGTNGSVSSHVDGGIRFSVDWGDGTQTAHNENTTATRTYSSAFTGDALVFTTPTRLLTVGGSALYPIIRSRDGLFSYSGGFARLNMTSPGTNSNWADFNPLARQFQITSANTITGTLDLTGMNYFVCLGSNTLSGILSLPSGITTFNCSGSNTLSGTLTLASSLTAFTCTGSNTLSGTLSLHSGLVTFDCQGFNTLTGTLSIPSGMSTFRCVGLNTLSGALTMPSSLTTFICQGNNSLSGTLSLPPAMILFTCAGTNTLSGAVTFPATMQQFVCQGSNTLTFSTFPASLNTLLLNATNPVGFRSSTDIDNILINLAAVGTSGAGTINLTGTANSARTAASDVAVTTLQGLGRTVITN